MQSLSPVIVNSLLDKKVSKIGLKLIQGDL